MTIETTYICVNDSFDQDQNEYTLAEFEAMCVDCFGEAPEMAMQVSASGVESYTVDGELVLADSVEAEDIEGLRDEALAHGDGEQAALCDAALSGDRGARIECAEVIRENRAR